MTKPIRHPLCAVDPTAHFPEDQLARRWFKILGPREPTPPKLFECGAPWTGHAQDAELVRLAKLEARIQMRERAAREDRAERTRIMMRCIRRMRRAKGVE